MGDRFKVKYHNKTAFTKITLAKLDMMVQKIEQEGWQMPLKYQSRQQEWKQ